jgi:hypothetical protein
MSMWTSDKFLKRALKKLERFSDCELVGYVTPQEVLLLSNFFEEASDRDSWPPLKYCEAHKKEGKTYRTTAYFTVARSCAEAYPKNPYYST